MLKRNEKLIRTKLLKYLAPAIMTNLALQVGNVVDTILVGNILGTNAMSAVQISGTILLVIQIPGWMLGVGGSIVVGNCLGKRDLEGASKVFSSCLFAVFVCDALIMLCSLLAEPIAMLLTAGRGVLTADVTSVIRVMFLGTPIVGICLFMMNIMAVDNNPVMSTVYVAISNVVNLIFDYVLLSFTDMGPAASFVSSILGYGLALVVIPAYVRSPKRMLKLTNPVKDTLTYFRLAFITGVPACLSIICEMARNSVMNVMILRFIGESGVAIYTVCLNVILIVELFLGGIIGAMEKIGGVIYGEKDYYGLRSITRNILVYSYSLLAVLMLLLYFFARQAAGMFGINDEALLSQAKFALRIFFLALPGYVFNLFFISYYSTTEHSGYANLITILEYCGVLLPAVFIFSRIAMMTGNNTLDFMMCGLVAGELLTALITVLTVKLRNRGEGILLLPEREEEVLDFSVAPDLKEASLIPHEIIGFCEDKVERMQANKMAVAAEEMAVNTIRYGGRSLKSIDVMLSVSKDELVLRQRDDGMPFDPTCYSFDSEQYEYDGIEAIRALTDKITYLRTLDLNNTTLEISMQKGCKEGVSLTGTNDLVSDILNKTGFGEILGV